MYGIEMLAQVVERQQTLKRWFTRALLRGLRHTLWSRVWGKPGGLLDLTTLLAKRNIHTARTTSCQTLPISRIRGSEGHCHDFDSAFHPRQTHTRDRWLHIARARQDGIEIRFFAIADIVSVSGKTTVLPLH